MTAKEGERRGDWRVMQDGKDGGGKWIMRGL